MTLGPFALALVGAASIVIWKACDYFDAGSTYVGRNMPPGVRGATINAIGSSLPELLTTFCLLFLFRDQDGYSAGIATCAGSAVFNAVIIPALVILAVVWKKKLAPHIELTRSVVLRDGAFFIGAELLLIYFLNNSTLKWWMGLGLMSVYVLYFSYMMMEIARAGTLGEADLYPDDIPSLEETDRIIRSAGMDPGEVGRRGVEFVAELRATSEEGGMTTGKAWRYLAASSAVIGAACYCLSWSVIELARWWDVPAFMTAVIFGAAATSVPDTMLSLKDALNGEYDDAVANAIGSNIFDITICLGLPLLCYGLVYGDVTVSSAAGSEANVQILRIGLVVVSTLVVGMFLISKELKTRHGVTLLGTFGAWLCFLGITGAI